MPGQIKEGQNGVLSVLNSNVLCVKLVCARLFSSGEWIKVYFKDQTAGTSFLQRKAHLFRRVS